MKSLVFSVEDDQNIQNVIQIALTNSNFDIKIFNSGSELLNALETQIPDIFLLDIMLPDMDGLEILKTLKKNPKLYSIPIMIISAKISEIDRVIGLDAGADDYLIKPFGVLELVSRVKALLRRAKPKTDSQFVENNGLLMDTKKHICKYNDHSIELTKKQFDLLLLFMNHPNEVISREDILNNVWGYEYVGETRTVDVHIKEIRRKLRTAGMKQQPIETIRGIGYQLVI